MGTFVLFWRLIATQDLVCLSSARQSQISPTAPLLSPAGWANQRVLNQASNRFVLLVEWLAGRATWRVEDGKPGAWVDQFHRCTQLHLHYSGRWRLENHRIRWGLLAGSVTG